MKPETAATVLSLILGGMVWIIMGMSTWDQTGAATLYRAMFPESSCLQFWLRVAASCLCLVSGLFARHCIKVEKQKNTVLKESERRFRLAFKATKDGLWDYNMEKNTTYFNSQYLEMLGYDANERPHCYDTWKSLVHPDDRDRTIHYIRNQIKNNEQYAVEFRMQSKSGDWVWILGRGQVMKRDKDGNPVRRVGTHSNITYRKEIEEELIKARKLESIGRLAGGMAHDYNNLLAAIMGNITLTKLQPSLTSASLLQLTQAESACMKAADLTKRLHTFSQGGAPIKKQCNLNDHIQDWTAQSLAHSNCRRHVRAADPHIDMECDADQIKTAVQNIITNADEATPDGGLIRIGLERVNFSNETIVNGTAIPRGSYIMLEIHDTGKGISKENLNRIFDPYFSTKELSVQKGMGMGLTTAYSIIKKHDGYIAATSSRDKGTRFRIYLPTKNMAGTA